MVHALDSSVMKTRGLGRVHGRLYRVLVKVRQRSANIIQQQGAQIGWRAARVCARLIVWVWVAKRQEGVREYGHGISTPQADFGGPQTLHHLCSCSYFSDNILLFDQHYCGTQQSNILT